jgi:hypothetical protein
MNDSRDLGETQPYYRTASVDSALGGSGARVRDTDRGGALHPRIRRQQLANPWLGLISHRPSRSTLILRRPLRGQRRLHRVPRNPQHPRDLRNRQALTIDATAGSLPSPPRSTLASSLAHSHGSPGSWSISVAAQWSVFRLRRHTWNEDARDRSRLRRVCGVVRDSRPCARVRFGRSISPGIRCLAPVLSPKVKRI